jgi:hypothetical protein
MTHFSPRRVPDDRTGIRDGHWGIASWEDRLRHWQGTSSFAAGRGRHGGANLFWEAGVVANVFLLWFVVEQETPKALTQVRKLDLNIAA